MQADQINVEWISTAKMLADGFIKCLFRQKHKEFVKQLHLINIIERLKKWRSLQPHLDNFGWRNMLNEKHVITIIKHGLRPFHQSNLYETNCFNIIILQMLRGTVWLLEIAM